MYLNSTLVGYWFGVSVKNSIKPNSEKFKWKKQNLGKNKMEFEFFKLLINLFLNSFHRALYVLTLYGQIVKP